jgi:hypothetical protein
VHVFAIWWSLNMSQMASLVSILLGQIKEYALYKFPSSANLEMSTNILLNQIAHILHFEFKGTV